MNQKIPFEKEITFKTKINEITSISLDNDLTLKGEDLITGNFYIKGTYKMTKASTLEEEYSYKIPCEIAISDDYDTYNCEIDIDDFNYEIINEEKLKVKIVVIIDNLIKKEKEEKEIIENKEELIQTEPLLEELKREEEQETRPEKVINEINPMSVITNIKPDILNITNDERYLTYSVYIVHEEDTIEKIIGKYKITKEQLLDYNTIDKLFPGMKLVIPSFINND